MRVLLQTAGLLTPNTTRLISIYPRLSRFASSSSTSPSPPRLSDEILTKNNRNRIQTKDDSSVVFEMPAPVAQDASIPDSGQATSPETIAVPNFKDLDIPSVKVDPPESERPAVAASTTSPLLSSTSTPELSSSSSPVVETESSTSVNESSSTTGPDAPSPLSSAASSTSNPVRPTAYPHDLQSLLAAHPALANQYNALAAKATKMSAQLQTKADVLKQDTLENLGLLGRKLNEFTGYDEIERLKQGVRDRENNIARLRSNLLRLKTTYLDSVTNRSTSQRELNDLLQRKHLWSTADVERFTSLVRGDHENMRLEEESKKALEDAETEVEKGFTEMMNAILNRYHEEQLWSDKLRSFSTYVSLTIMVANLVVFITAIVFVEPWKRKRMVESFEKKVEEMRIGLEEKLNAVGLGLSTGAAIEESQDARRSEETNLQDDVNLVREVWEEIKMLRNERDEARLQAQSSVSSSVSLPSPVPPSSPESSVDMSPPVIRPPIVSFHQTYPFVTFSYQSFINIPHSIVRSSSQAISSTRSFLQTSWRTEGTERDLVVVGTGAALSGGLIVGILKEIMK